MHLTRRRFLVGIALPIGGALLAACTPAQTPAPTSPPSTGDAQPAAASPTAAAASKDAGQATPAAEKPASSGGKQVVKFMHFYPNPLMENMNRRLALFNENPTYAVEGIQTPGAGAYRDKLLTMIAGGVAPDAFLISQAPGSGYSFGILAERGQMVDMNPLVSRDNYDIDDFFKVIVDYDTYKGKLYALPNDINVYAMFYNVDLFKEAGVSTPPDAWADEAWNWNALVETAKQLTKHEGNRTLQFGFAVIRTSIEWLQPWLWNNGASDLNAEWTQSTINTPEAIEALTYLQDLIHTHKVSPAPADAQDMSEGEMFFTGRLAMMYSGASFVNQCRSTIDRFEWNTGAYVVGKAGHVTACGGASFAISQQSKVQDGAWELCKSMSGTESQAIGADYGQMPSRLSVANGPRYLDPSKPPQNLQIFIEAAKNARPGYLITNWSTIDQEMRKELDYLWLNQKKPAEVAANLEQIVNKLLAEGERMN